MVPHISPSSSTGSNGCNDSPTFVLSRLSNNGNQNNTYESTYTTENISELYDIDELPDGTFSLSFNIIDRYQREYPFLTEKLNSADI